MVSMASWNMGISCNNIVRDHPQWDAGFPLSPTSFLIPGQICGECAPNSLWSSLSGSSNDGALNQTVTLLGENTNRPICRETAVTRQWPWPCLPSFTPVFFFVRRILSYVDKCTCLCSSHSILLVIPIEVIVGLSLFLWPFSSFFPISLAKLHT